MTWINKVPSKCISITMKYHRNICNWSLTCLYVNNTWNHNGNQTECCSDVNRCILGTTQSSGSLKRFPWRTYKSSKRNLKSWVCKSTSETNTSICLTHTWTRRWWKTVWAFRVSSLQGSAKVHPEQESMINVWVFLGWWRETTFFFILENFNDCY